MRPIKNVLSNHQALDKWSSISLWKSRRKSKTHLTIILKERQGKKTKIFIPLLSVCHELEDACWGINCLALVACPICWSIGFPLARNKKKKKRVCRHREPQVLQS